MKITSIGKVQQLMQRITEIDIELKTFQKIAKHTGSSTGEYKIAIEAPTKKTKPLTHFDIDGDDELFHIRRFLPTPSFIFNTQTGERSQLESMDRTTVKIDEVVLLQLMGVITAHRENERLTIIKELEKNGVSIQF